MSRIAMDGLCFDYGGTPVLDGLDLSVESGGLTALIGPSGCGKTTLLRLLAGFERPRSGTVAIGDRVVAGAGRTIPAHRRRVGVVPQEGALFPHLDVTGNVGYGLSRRDPGRRARIGALLELVGLDGLGARLPRELSGGQQQRVAVARALAPRPEVVLLDEPFASLDADTRARVREGVRAALDAENATAVMVTHDRDEALSLADRVAVMRAGRVVQHGTPHDVYARPVDADVARTLGPVTELPATELPTPRGAGTLLLRPEQVRASSSDPGEGAPAMRGLVLASTFHGAGTRVRVRVGEHEVLAETTDPGVVVGGTAWLRVTGDPHVLPSDARDSRATLHP